MLERLVIRPVDPDSPDMEAVYDLRLRVLRPGRPPEAVRLKGDWDPRTVILGAFDGERLVGVCALFPNDGLQLRQMAVEPDMQGQGIGAEIVRRAQDISQERGEPLWCQARDWAIGFYEKQGWTVVGEGFTVPDVGPHHVMRWRPM